ncbi:Exopolygalacturonase [Triticum urartu]|uniref:Exopolygalacturonase n=1 Tax=Triticum urartu TaxID=4572 RepID=M7Z439_TRIUA|nr:Exopolygalacturonase [Triticum urartu]
MEVWPPLLVVIFTLYVVSPCCGLEAVAKNVTVAQLLPISSYHGGLATYNAKNFGAEGNGTNDDTKVRIQFLNRLLGVDGSMEGSVWCIWHGDAVDPAGDVLHRADEVPWSLQSLRHHLLAPGKQLCSYKIAVQARHDREKGESFYMLVQGTLKAATDLRRFGNDWIEFGWVKDLTVAGQNNAIINGQGAASWPFNKCPFQKDCKVLPTSVLFVNNQNTVVRDITSVNSKFFHIALLQSKNMKLINIQINAPENSPNTDGIHIERSTGVVISDTHISTGDDCISIGQGSDNIDIARVHCGPGHGMSVGSLGRYVDEGDVTRVHVRSMTFVGTMNGVRIKTWENSPTKSLAAHMLFENMIMKDVQNPIIIDQKYCPYYDCEHKHVSGVTLKDITFKNIKGTSSTPVAVRLRCGVPCQGVVLQDVDLKYMGEGGSSSKCENAMATEPPIAGVYASMEYLPSCSIRELDRLTSGLCAYVDDQCAYVDDQFSKSNASKKETMHTRCRCPIKDLGFSPGEILSLSKNNAINKVIASEYSLGHPVIVDDFDSTRACEITPSEPTDVQPRPP